MDFEIKRIITAEFNNGKLDFDLNALEDYISNKLKEKSFGSSVIKFFWGFEVYKFNGGFVQFFQNDIESWKFSKKWFVVNSHFDWNQVVNLSMNELLTLIKKEILMAIDRIGKMKKRPKDFNYISFRNEMEIILKDFNIK